MQVRLYTTSWCPDCHRAKWFLRQHGIPYEEVDIDRDPEAEALVLRYNAGRRRVPTIQIGDRFYGNPPLALLGELLGVRS